jgi:glyoxylate reductase
MVGERELKLMKPTALLINTARGQIVDQAALIRALKEKWIAGAGLDVFEDETHIPEELRSLSNTILTPHTASATIEARLAMAKIVVDNIADAIENRQPSCLVNPDVWQQKID